MISDKKRLKTDKSDPSKTDSEQPFPDAMWSDAQLCLDLNAFHWLSMLRPFEYAILINILKLLLANPSRGGSERNKLLKMMNLSTPDQ